MSTLNKTDELQVFGRSTLEALMNVILYVIITGCVVHLVCSARRCESVYSVIAHLTSTALNLYGDDIS